MEKATFDINTKLATRMKSIRANAIRQIFHFAAQPGMIALSGGYPFKEGLIKIPIDRYVQQAAKDFSGNERQYGQTEGIPKVREIVAKKLLGKRGITTTEAEVLITPRSQSALDLVGKTFIGKGDKVIVEAPTYLGALQAWDAYEPEYLEAKMDNNGTDPEYIEALLRKNPNTKLIYLIPDFQNPRGTETSLERRQRIIELADMYGTIIVEDDPYGFFRYEGQPIPTIKELAGDRPNIIYITTFSKIFAPGLSLGAVNTSPEILSELAKAAQGTYLHPSTLAQGIAYEFLKGDDLNKHLAMVLPEYKKRWQIMKNELAALKQHGFIVSDTRGGLFFWIEAPRDTDMNKVNDQLIANHVVIIPGQSFYANRNRGKNTARLNFSNQPPEKIQEALQIAIPIFLEASSAQFQNTLAF